MGFQKYPGKTWDICECRDSNDYSHYHFLRRNDDGTWSQRICEIITKYFAKDKFTIKTPHTIITDANYLEALTYAGYPADSRKVQIKPHPQS